MHKIVNYIKLVGGGLNLRSARGIISVAAMATLLISSISYADAPLQSQGRMVYRDGDNKVVFDAADLETLNTKIADANTSLGDLRADIYGGTKSDGTVIATGIFDYRDQMDAYTAEKIDDLSDKYTQLENSLSQYADALKPSLNAYVTQASGYADDAKASKEAVAAAETRLTSAVTTINQYDYRLSNLENARDLSDEIKMVQEGQGVTITWSGLVEYVTVGGYRVLNGGTYKIPANTVIQAIGATTMNWTHSFHTSGGNSGIKYSYTTTEANAIGALAFGGAEYFTGSISGVTSKNAVTSASLTGGNTTNISYLSSTSGTASVVSDLSYSTAYASTGIGTVTVDVVKSPITLTRATVPTTAGATSQTVVTSLPTISAPTASFLSGTPTVTISSYYGGWVTRSGGCSDWAFSASK